jgi:hypothetical protein
MKTNIHLWSYLAQFFLELEMFQGKVVDKIKTFYVQFFFTKNYAFYEVMWRKIVLERDRPHMAI